MRNYGAAALVSAVLLHGVSPCPALQVNQKEFAYDVVSVRDAKGDPDSSHIHTGRDSLSAYTAVRPFLKYALRFLWSDQVEGLPNWALSTQYHIEAKMDDDTRAALDRLPVQDRDAARREMCVQILTDRFGLKFHHETKRLPVYNLVVAMDGPKLKQSDPQTSGVNSTGGRTKLVGTGMTPSEIAVALGYVVGDRHVIDKTGLTGRFDLELNWSVDEGQDTQSVDAKPSVITAIREQLGLKLVPSKAPVDVIVVDAISKPSEN